MKNNSTFYTKLTFVDGQITQLVTVIALLSPLFFYLPGLIFSPTIGDIVLCIIGLISGIFYFLIITVSSANRKRRELISGYLDQFAKCSFHSYLLDDYSYSESSITLASRSIRVIDYNDLKIHRNSVNDAKIYVVKRGQSNKLPLQMVSYPTSLFSAPFIFIRDEPDRIMPLGRFFIFHEIGHSSAESAVPRDISRLLWILFALPLFLGIINFQPSIINTGLIGIYLSLLVIAKPIHKHLLQSQKYFDEINADLFAIKYLSDDDRDKLANYIEKAGGLPKDLSLTNSENASRSALLINELKNSADNQYRKNLPFLFSRYIPYLFLPLAILTPIIGYFMGVPDFVNPLCGRPMLLLIALTIGLFVAIATESSREKKINDFLLEKV